VHGHRVGDDYLRHVAKLMGEHFGPEALVSRLGGDEFSVVLPRISQDRLEMLIGNLTRAVEADVTIKGVTLTSSLSLGIAVPEDGESFGNLLQRADTALYFAKTNGRNRAAFYTDDMGDAARRRRNLEDRLNEALRFGTFELAYQPLVNARDSRVIGYEALLRLKDVDGTPISPGEFIPLAEEIGLIENIGAWVLDRAMHDIACVDDHSKVSINLSADQFQSGKLIETVAAAMQRSGLPSHRLELEITENILLGDDAKTKFQIDALKDMGISIAMDDFGTGFSSLSTLWKYGFDRIKIDKSFVHALDEAPETSKQLIDTIILLGTRMGMSVTAEGIETEAQEDVLVKLGCNVLQGFYFGKPAPIETIRQGMRNAS